MKYATSQAVMTRSMMIAAIAFFLIWAGCENRTDTNRPLQMVAASQSIEQTGSAPGTLPRSRSVESSTHVASMDDRYAVPNSACPDDAELVGRHGEEQWCEKNTVKHGRYTLWHHNGVKRMEVEYRDGLMHGKSVTWYPNGTKSGEVDVVDGREQGAALGWHSDGKLRARGQVRDGRPCGTIERWDADGNPAPCRKDYQLVFGCSLTSTGAQCPACDFGGQRTEDRGQMRVDAP